jgi:hypothetical protein
MLHARSVLFLLPLLALAQDTAPPPEVDQALRERCTQFFRYHTDTETQKTNFRKAWELVAEESKDFYFSGHKQTYKSFKIDSIKYSDNFTKAKVQLTTEVLWEIRMQKQIAKVITTASWKLENGKWMWYDDPQERWPTPMGPSDLTKLTRNPDGTVQVPRDFSIAALTKAAQDQVKPTTIDKNNLTLTVGTASQEKVVLHNGAPGYINLELDKGAPIPGLTFELDKTQVGPNQDATLKIAYQPVEKYSPDKPALAPFKVKLTVVPFNQVFEVSVKFVAPAQ